MKYKEFEKRTRSIEIQHAAISMIDEAMIYSTMMRNAQEIFSRCDVCGITASNIKKINDDHRIMRQTLENLYNLLDSIDSTDVDQVKYIVRDLCIAYENGNYEFEE